VAEPLRERIRAESTAALKAGDKVRLAAFRMLSTAVTVREKEVLHELSDDEVREVAAKELKKRTESIEAFEGAGRLELAERERAERDALAPFAPDPLPDAEVDALVEEAIASTGAASIQDLGKVMGFVMARGRGRLDGAAVQRSVRARLEG
jgi:uncharacterized protein YqeY